MQERILSLVETLDESRKDILSRLESLTEIQLAFKPDKDAWSPLDIAEHCVKAEASLFSNMPEPGSGIHTSPTIVNRINLLWRRSVLMWKIPVPVPAQALLPQGKLSLGEIAEIWGEHMAWLRIYIEKTPTKVLEYAFFRHPTSGPLTICQALNMAILHIGYHLPALEDRIKASKLI